jgi:hypothetical protein
LICVDARTRGIGDVVSAAEAAEAAGDAEALEVLLDEEFRGDDPFRPAIEGCQSRRKQQRETQTRLLERCGTGSSSNGADGRPSAAALTTSKSN